MEPVLRWRPTAVAIRAIAGPAAPVIEVPPFGAFPT